MYTIFIVYTSYQCYTTAAGGGYGRAGGVTMDICVSGIFYGPAARNSGGTIFIHFLHIQKHQNNVKNI